MTSTPEDPGAAGRGPRLLMVPVSGPRGMGEYARCLAIAESVRRRWPTVEIRFLLNREAPYAATCPFPVTALPASPTRCTREVVAQIRGFRPQLVFFDNAGRTRQLQAARAAGARVVYVSSRGRQRRKAFRLRWMALLDEHWISYSAALAGELSTLERWKLRWRGRPAVRFLDAVIATPDGGDPDGAASGPDPDVIVVPGGGSAYPDAPIAPRHFVEWAIALAAQGRRVLVVGGPSFDVPTAAAARLAVRRGVSGGALMRLLARSRIVLVNGGDTFAQALALGCICVAVPIAGDQAARIGRAAALGVVEAPAPADVVTRCTQLLEDPAARARLQSRLEAQGWHDAMPVILERVGSLLGVVGGCEAVDAARGASPAGS